jgi:hypothetical protein
MTPLPNWFTDKGITWRETEVAMHKDTPIEILEKLATEHIASVDGALLKNPRINRNILKELSKSTDYRVRFDVTKHRLIDSEILAMQARDPDWGVRWAVAMHVKTTPLTLVALSTDENAYVKLAANVMLKKRGSEGTPDGK